MALNYELEQERTDKIKELGYLCYNISVGNVSQFPQFKNILSAMHSCAELIRQSVGAQREQYAAILDDYAAELGCACFNMYVDKRIFSDKIIDLCISISDINHEMICAEETSAQTEEIQNEDAARSMGGCASPHTARENFEPDGIKFNLPYGMEPIPINGKQCICGYRNREYARYCGKCGAKL